MRRLQRPNSPDVKKISAKRHWPVFRGGPLRQRLAQTPYSPSRETYFTVSPGGMLAAEDSNFTRIILEFRRIALLPPHGWTANGRKCSLAARGGGTASA